MIDVEVKGLGTFHVHLQGNLLEVQDDVCGVLNHSRDRRELVQHALDLHRRDGHALNRGEQHPAKGVADGRTKTPLEGLSVELPVPIGQRLQIASQAFRFLKAFPKHCSRTSSIRVFQLVSISVRQN